MTDECACWGENELSIISCATGIVHHGPRRGGGHQHQLTPVTHEEHCFIYISWLCRSRSHSCRCGGCELAQEWNSSYIHVDERNSTWRWVSMPWMDSFERCVCRSADIVLSVLILLFQLGYSTIEVVKQASDGFILTCMHDATASWRWLTVLHVHVWWTCFEKLSEERYPSR
jgi:hypothetical protein